MHLQQYIQTEQKISHKTVQVDIACYSILQVSSRNGMRFFPTYTQACHSKVLT